MGHIKTRSEAWLALITLTPLFVGGCGDGGEVVTDSASDSSMETTTTAGTEDPTTSGNSESESESAGPTTGGSESESQTTTTEDPTTEEPTTDSSGTSPCEPGQQQCGDFCFDDDDPNHCGDCGVSCEEDEMCIDGECVVDLEEICDGEDNDNDGEIDEDFPDSDNDGMADCIDNSCDTEPAEPGEVEIDLSCTAPDVEVLDPWNVAIEWQWQALMDNPSARDSYSTPVIGNLTDDNDDGEIDELDTPDIATVLKTGHLGVLDVATGDEHWSAPGFRTGTALAIADVSWNGLNEIVAITSGLQASLVEGSTGLTIWTSTATSTYIYPLPTVADIDGDGTAEVIHSEHVLNGLDGSLLFSMVKSPGIPYTMPAVADLDLDGQQEIVLGTSVYDNTGNELWTTGVSGNYGHWAAILNADDDDEAEVVFVGGGRMAIHDHDGNVLVDVATNGATRPGPPCAGDFDGDQETEIAMASNGIMTVLELDGSVVWSTAMINDPSGLAGCSAYDINGDGIYEILFADQDRFYIFDGATGETRFVQDGHNSGTVFEYPTVADVDNDGSAEIVFVSFGWQGDWGTVTVLGHGGDGWQKSGRTWPIHDFAVTNIEPDGSVPAEPVPWWQVYNIYRARPTVDDAAVDLGVEFVDVCTSGCEPQNAASAIVQVYNQGGVDSQAGVPVSLYRKDADIYELLETQVLADPVLAGTSTSGLIFMLTFDQIGADGLVVRVDDDGNDMGIQTECNESNNEASFIDPLCG